MSETVAPYGITVPTEESDFNLWGGILNEETVQLLQKLISGIEAISLTGNLTITSTAGADNQARNFALIFSDGGLGSVPTVTIPGVEKVYLAQNLGATYAITISAGGTTASLPANQWGFVRCDGANCVFLGFAALTSAEISDALFRILGSSDATKKVAFEVDGLTTATTRTLTIPDVSAKLLGLDPAASLVAGDVV